MNTTQQEWINVFASFINIPLMVSECVIAWYIGLGLSIHTLYLNYQHRAWVLCMIRSVFIMNSCYGLYKWTVGARRPKNKLQITKTAPKTWLKVFTLASIGGVLFYLALIWLVPEEWKGQVKNPALDTLVLTIVFTGQRLSAHKKLESQLFWIGHNIVMIYNRAVIQGSVLWVKHLVYLPLCFWGYTVWLRKYKKAQRKQQGF